MKKKLTIFFLCVLTIIASAFGLAACGGNSTDNNSGGGSGGDTHTEHTYDQQVTTADYLCTEATCTAKARYYYSCSCGEKGTETFESGQMLEHNYTETAASSYLKSSATCTEAAVYYKSCSVCGAASTETFESDSALGHSYTETVADTYLKTAATCTDKAVYYKSCSGCGAVSTETFEYGDASGHHYVELYGDDGSLIWNESEYIEVPDNLKTAATCSSKAVYYKVCSGCGEMSTETFEDEYGDYDYTHHVGETEIKNTILATCLTTGYSGDTYCKSCGNKISSGSTVEKLAHTFSAGDDGLCTVCGVASAVALSFTLNDDGTEYSVTDCDLSVVKLVVPSTYNDLPVTSIESKAFADCASLTSITIPDSVTSVGEEAFENCTSLTYNEYDNAYYLGNNTNKYVVLMKAISTDITSCTINENTKFIYDSAFKDCTSLTSIKIPDSVRSIGSAAFSGCSALESITLPFVGTNAASTSASSSTLFGYIFGTTSYTGGTATKQYYSWGTGIYTNDTYYLPTTLKSVTITGGNILYGAFYNCSYLTSVTISDSVKSIGDDAFYGCTSLTNITIPDSVTGIGSSAFYGCSSLTYNEYDNAYYLGDNTNKYVVLMKAVSTDITSCTINANTKFIYDSAFEDCTSLESITIPGSVTSIGWYAFEDCTSLTSITIPDSVTSIGRYAFYGCAAEIKWGDNPTITEIGEYAFAYYEGTSITIPDSVTSIGNYAFRNCTSLTSITIPDSVTSIGSSAFGGCISLTSISVDEKNANYKSVEGNLYNRDGTTLIQYAIGKTDTAFTIPDSVTGIGYYAFEDCASLTSVTIGNSVSSIGYYAFDGCYKLIEVYNLSSLNITAGEKGNGYVGYYAKNVYTSTSVASKLATTEEGYVFYEDGETVYLMGYTGTATALTLPDKYNSKTYKVYKYAFRNCTLLTSITIPDSVTSIGSAAFSGCSSLTSMTLSFVGAKAGVTSSDTYQYPFGYIFGTTSYTGGTATEQYYYGSGTSWTTSTTYYIPTTLTGVTITGGNILYGAFYGCSKLTSITISDSVTSIGNYAFYNCTALTEINYNTTECADLSSNNYVFYKAGQSGGGITVNIGANVTKIPAYLFYPYYNSSYAPKITNVVFAKGSQCESIGTYAFYGCSKLTSITIPDSVTSIGDDAFYYCSKLIEVYNLSSLEITAGSTDNGYVGYYAKNVYTATSGASKLATTDDGYVFYVDGDTVYLMGYTGTATELMLPDKYNDKTYEIYKYAFRNCTALTSITIPDSVMGIGSYAFSGCMAEIKWGDNPTITEIGEYAFASYNGTSITIPDGVTSIGSYAFRNCTSLTSITIPDGVTSIGDDAFAYCTLLTSVTIGSGVTSIGRWAFYNCTALTEINYNATGCADLSSKNYVFYCAGQSGGGITVNIGANVTKIPAYLFYPYDSSSYAPKTTSVVFAEGSKCTSIGDYAFEYCTSLVNVYYGGTVEAWCGITFGGSTSDPMYYASHFYMKDNSGEWQEVTEITIPNTVKAIGDYQFYGFENVTSITIPDGVTSIGEGALNGCTSLTSITIPDSVTSIGDRAFLNCTALTSVTIGGGVTSIGRGAFSGCSSLTSMTLPFVGAKAGVTSSDTYQYPLGYIFGTTSYTCGTATTQYYYESSTSSTTSSTYYIPTTLKSVTITGGNILYGAFYNCSNLTSVTIGSSVTSIGSSAFYGCSKLTSITIGSSVTSIGWYAFYNCSSLTSITIPDGVTSIGYYAFSGCTSLTSVTIGSSVTSIGWYAFYKCTSLTSITIPDSVTSIGIDAFYNCTALEDVYYGGTIANWCGITFSDSDANPMYYASHFYLKDNSGEWEEVTEITIPDTITKIGACQFYGFENVTSITIPDSVTNIGDSAFYNCTALTEINYNATACAGLSNSNYVFYGAGQSGDGIMVNIGANVTKIPAYLFYPYYNSSYAPKIASIVFASDSKCTSIGNAAFYNCTSLTSITIPDSVTSIGYYAFSGCTAEIKWEDNPTITKIDEQAFAGYAGTSITIPDGVTSIGSYAFSGCTSLESIEIPDNVTSIGDYAFSKCTSLTSVQMGSSVTSIGSYAFYNCPSLESITIPDSVTSIGLEAFNGCASLIFNEYDNAYYLGNDTNNYVVLVKAKSTDITSCTINENTKFIADAFDGCTLLTSVTIGSSVTSIDDYVFEDCTSLTSVTIGSSVTSIGDYAFYNCPSLESITIPDSVTSIGWYAFYGCTSLTSVTIGNGVTSIGRSAFRSCTALTTINYNATECADLSDSNCVFYEAGQSGEGITVNIGANVTKIPAYLFYPYYESGYDYSPKVTSVVLAEGSKCESIGSSAFEYCTSLTSITIPDSVTSIGDYAFRGCTSLTSITVDDNNANYKSIDGNLYSKDGSTLIRYAIGKTNTAFTIPDSVTSIGDYAFEYCTSLTSITIPDNVTSIGWYAFYNCTSLTNVTIGSGVKSIGWYAFYNCTSLTSITIPNSVTSIGESAFRNCTALTSITIPDSVTSIGSFAFSGCTALTSITIPNSVTSIGSSAFSGCTALTSITIPNNVTSIGNYAFGGCYRLVEVYNLSSLGITAGSENNGCAGYYAKVVHTSASEASNLHTTGEGYIFLEDGDTVYLVGYTGTATELTLPDKYNNKTYEINNCAFYGCASLTSVTIPDSVTSIGDYAFRGCTSLTSIKIPDRVTSIGYETFYYCTSLTSITIPDSVTSIGSFAFSGCTSLTSVTIGSSVKSIGDYAFCGCDKLIEVYNLSSLNITAGGSGNGYVGYYAKNVYTSTSGASKLATTEDGYIFYEDGDTVYLMGYTGTATALTLPDKYNGKTYEVYKYAFYCCTSLTSVTIGSGVTSIGDDAFYYCTSLTNVTIGSGVKNIAYSAFRGCTSLTSITIPDSVTSIGNYAFYYCTSLTNVTIGSGVTSIGYETFYYCTALTSITIGSGVTSIGSYAFYGCPKLTTVYYGGTATQWSSITIDSSNSYLTSATRYYYSESEPSLNNDGTAYDGTYWHYVDGVVTVWTKED